MRILRRWTLMAVVLTLAVTLGLYVYRTVFAYTYDGSLKGADLAANVTPDSGVTNIALFGVDTRTVDIGTRSDTMMVLTVDNKRHKLKLTSLMRDSRVEVEGHDEDKLCHAYAYGGSKLAIRTINRNFGMDIQDYITVDFAQMKALVDAVGGIWIDVSEKERIEANKFIKAYQKEKGVPRDERTPIEEPGYQHLNGVQAMCYARIRKGGTGDDWGRVERQSVVLNAMLGQVKNLSAGELVTLVQTMMDDVTTSLSPAELMPLVLGAVKGGMPELVHTRVPVDGAWEYSPSGQYIVYDLEQASDALRAFIYDDILPVSAAHTTAA